MLRKKFWQINNSLPWLLLALRIQPNQMHKLPKIDLNILNGFLWVEFEIIYWARIGSFSSSAKIRWIIFCCFSARMRWSNTFTDFTARVSRTRAKFFGPRKTDLSIKQRKARKRGQVSCGIQRISYLLFPRAWFWRYFRSESKKTKNRLCYPTRQSVENFRIFSEKLFGF